MIFAVILIFFIYIAVTFIGYMFVATSILASDSYFIAGIEVVMIYALGAGVINFMKRSFK